MPSSTPVRFGVFELDQRSGELRRSGLRVRLADQPRQILQLLLERPGELVTREQLRERLWTEGTFVDFETGLNSAVRKLREALGDSAASPRFIERVPRRGYRFIAPVITTPVPGDSPQTKPSRFAGAIGPAGAASAVLLLATGAALIAYAAGRPGPAEPVAPPPTAARVSRAANPFAQDLYVKGMLAFGGQSAQSIPEAIGYFERAVAADPEFAEGYSALGQARYQWLVAGAVAPRDVAPAAETAARRAIALDDTLAAAHRTLGAILHTYYWNWDEGDREFRRARELSGSAVDLHGLGFQGLIRARRLDEALAEAMRIRTLDPQSFNAHLNVAVAHRAAGRLGGAIEALRRATALHPRRARGYFQLGATFVLMGRPRDAIPEFERACRASAEANPRFEAYLAYAYAATGESRKARRILQSLEDRRRSQYVSAFGLALIHDALGDTAAALAAFERAYRERAVEFAQSEQYPRFTRIAADPRFVELMRSIGLPAGPHEGQWSSRRSLPQAEANR